MDDFLFQPWTVTVRTGDQDRGAPGPGAAQDRRVEPGDETSSIRIPEESRPSAEESSPSVEQVSPTPEASSPAAEAPTPAPRAHRREARGRLDSIAGHVGELLVPLIEAWEPKLHVGRHRTATDDRLHRADHCFRFRLVPRYGPLDDPPSVPGSVLEVCIVDEETIAAHLWLDPLAEEPAEELTIEPSLLGSWWLEEVLLDFVAKTLRQA